MTAVFLALILCCVGLAMLSTIAVVSRRKKLRLRNLQLIGVDALSNSMLSPEGTILISGELWRARSADGRTIPTHTKVHVVDLKDHLLLVDRV